MKVRKVFGTDTTDFLNGFQYGSESLQVAGKIGLVNSFLNMTNNFETFLYEIKFQQDATINTAKTFTETL